MSNVTRILAQIDAGETAAAEALLPLVYDELRKLAAARLAHEKPGQTLQATALVHEAYLRLVARPGVRDQESGVREDADQQCLPPDSCPLTPDSCPPTPAFHSRGHFFAAAAEAMRRILIDQARRKKSERHGGELVRIELDEGLLVGAGPRYDLLELDELLEQLAATDPQAAELVKLRFFAGLTGDQAAEVLGISPRSADLLWSYARAWLFEKLQPTRG